MRGIGAFNCLPRMAISSFSWDAEHPSTTSAERQDALRTQRQQRDRYASLEQRLTAVTKAFELTAVKTRVASHPRLKEMRRDWERIREASRELGQKRNKIGHTFLHWHIGEAEVQRQVGRPWSEHNPVSEVEDKALRDELHRLSIEIARYTTEVGQLLPFADADQIIA